MKIGKFFKKLFTKTFFIIITIICMLAVFFYWGWFGKQTDKLRGMYYVHQGDKAYHQGKLQNAISMYKKGLEYYPEHYSAWYNLGNIYVVYEDYYGAAEAYESAINYNSKYISARMNLGIIETEKLGDFDNAIMQYRQILNTQRTLLGIPFIFNNTKSTKRNKGLAYYNMGVAYRKKSLYDENKRESNTYLLKSIDAYESAVKILTNDYDARYNLAIAYHLEGNYNSAGESYCKAIELEPMNYEAHYNLAILLRHLKMYKEAYDEIEKASLLISDGHADTNTSSYIFDVLNDISRMIVISKNKDYFIEKLHNQQTSDQVTYVNGKIVATDDLDRAILENLKKCSSKDFFENN